MASPYIKCPHCGTRMRTSAHKTISPIFKTLVATCQNPECLASVTVNVEIDKQLQPSLLLNTENRALGNHKEYHDEQPTRC